MLGEVIFWGATSIAFATVLSYATAQPRRRSVLAPPATLITRRRDITTAFDTNARRHVLATGTASDRLWRVREAKSGLVAATAEPQAQLATLTHAELTASLYEELLRLADRDPKAALARIAKLPVEDRFNPLIRFVRIYAFGNLIWPEHVDDPEQFFKGLSRKQIGYAEQGVEEIAAIERVVPDFFNRNEMMQVAHRVCSPLEYHRPGAVQRALGWTKLVFWLFDTTRFLTISPDHPNAEDLKDLPFEKHVDLMTIRFSCERLVMSSCLVAARRTPQGWSATYILGARKGEPGGKIARLDPIGILTLREDGRWNISDWDA